MKTLIKVMEIRSYKCDTCDYVTSDLMDISTHEIQCKCDHINCTYSLGNNMTITRTCINCKERSMEDIDGLLLGHKDLKFLFDLLKDRRETIELDAANRETCSKGANDE